MHVRTRECVRVCVRECVSLCVSCVGVYLHFPLCVSVRMCLCVGWVLPLMIALR